ncbi:MAG: TraR/DksA C4-type zinc finger protein [Pirellulales bacterium]|nr:TraR/DksA C4-type zinc finger protein [Pirellulales bacterium]
MGPAMNEDIEYLELSCPDCSWSEVCGPAGVARWLRAAKKVRTGREPQYDIMVALLLGTAGQLTCPRCGRTGLAAGPPRDDVLWADNTTCQSCSRPIPRERLEAVPGTRLCAACRQAEESGGAGEVEYCPRCGSPMELRLSRSAGISRYVMECTASPPCRR